MAHELPALPYSFDALEPFFDARTMEIHHGKHHQAYVNKLNEALQKHPELQSRSVEELLRDLNSVPEDIRTMVRNHGGGHANHSFWWPLLKKDAGQPKGDLSTAINSAFGSFDGFKEKFSATAAGQFGSGWGWLVLDGNSGQCRFSALQIRIIHFPRENSNPIVDVWEHAYYLKYQNRRPEYLEAFSM